jgi:hypothetical protein
VGRREYVEVWRTNDDVRFVMTERVIAPQGIRTTEIFSARRLVADGAHLCMPI